MRSLCRAASAPRMKMGDRPKQYIEVGGKPILAYTLERFQKAKYVDRIVIVAAKQWRDYLTQWIDKLGISRFYAFADPGETRQESVLSGLKACLNGENTEDDLVAVQDGVRPLLSVGQMSIASRRREAMTACCPCGRWLKRSIIARMDQRSMMFQTEVRFIPARRPRCSAC